VRRGRAFVARPRHPVTGRQLYVAAASPGELARYVGELAIMRRELRLGLTSAEDVATKLARMKHGDATVERAARSYMAADVARNTRRRVASAIATHLQPLLELRLVELEAPRLSGWIEGMRRVLAPSSVTTQWRTLRAIVRHAAERGWIARAPWGAWRPSSRASSRTAVPRLQREAARTPHELALLLEAAERVDLELRRRLQLGGVEAKIACASLLGLRQRELAGLRWHDVDPGAAQVAIVRQDDDEPTKTRRVDRLQAVPELFETLERWRLVLHDVGLHDAHGPVFPYLGRHRSAGFFGPIHHYPVRVEVLSAAMLRRVVRTAGLPDAERWTPHSLRDSFATLSAIAAGGDLKAVQERTRHATLGSLVRYLRALERSHGAPSPLFELPARAPRPELPAGAPRGKLVLVPRPPRGEDA